MTDRTLTTEYVTVSGQVAEAGGIPIIRAPWPVGINAVDDQTLTVEGHNLPHAGEVVSATGYLTGTHLVFESWSGIDVVPSSWESTRTLPGVPPEVSAEAMRSRPGQQSRNELSSGESKNADGDFMTVLHVRRMNPALAEWLSLLPMGAAYVFPFVRAAGSPPVVASGPV